jgi:cytochrome c556
MWMRINALAAAALLSLLSTEAVQAQSHSANTQFMIQQHQMMNQMDMMRRSQTLQAMARAREAKEAQSRCRGPAQGGTGKFCRTAPRKAK